MCRKSIFLLIFVLSLGFLMFACTTGGRSSRYPRYPNYPPGGQGYPGYPGYPPGYNTNQQQIETLADHLKDATAEVTEEAKDTLEQNPEFVENSTMTLLEDLEKEANEFRSNLDGRRDTYQDTMYGDPRYGYPGSSGDTRREQFTEVLQKYYAARKTLGELPQEGEVQKDFERVTAIMRNLTRLYGYRFDPDYEYLEPTIR
jgi:hypothetical protein